MVAKAAERAIATMVLELAPDDEELSTDFD